VPARIHDDYRPCSKLYRRFALWAIRNTPSETESMRLPFANLLRRKTAPALPPLAHSKRRHPRLSFEGRATLCWTEYDQPHQLRANLVNASQSGMAVTARRPLPIGVRVWILLNDGTDGRAEVCYCKPVGNRFQTGFQFIADERPSRRDPGAACSFLEWIDASNRLAASRVEVRNGDEAELQVVVPQVVPCPAIVMLSAHEVRCLCCTRDGRPDGNSYRYRIEVLTEAFPNNQAA
jgi:PilZ domain